MRLEDGNGNGKYAAVNDEHMLQTLAHTVEFVHHVNHEEREAYGAVFNIVPDGLGDIFLYLKNTSDKDLVVYSLIIFADSTEDIEIYMGSTGTASGGNDLIPTNRTSGTANTADCICKIGTNITGLSGGNLTERIVLNNGLTRSEKFDWHSAFILPENTALTLRVGVGDGARIKGTLSFYFHDIAS